MKPIKKGEKSKHVESVQQLLNYSYPVDDKLMHLKVDGHFGSKTELAIKNFQKKKMLIVNGQVDRATYHALLKYSPYPSPSKHIQKKNRFIAFIDAGHGGVGIHSGSRGYVTPGKRWYHPGERFHYYGNYYEGVENRNVALLVMNMCASAEIMCIPVFHPVDDNSLDSRAKIIGGFMDMGFDGMLVSIHSNAVSTDGRTQNELNKIRGLSVWTTYGENLSDACAEVHIKNLEYAFPGAKIRRQMKDGDSDHEANFKVLKASEAMISARMRNFAGLLEEFEFHTSLQGTRFIIENRVKRAKTIFKTIVDCKNNLY